MTYAELPFMGTEHYASSGRPRDRLRRFLRARLNGPFQAKQLARIADCTPKTAENILASHWPNDVHLAAIVRHFGADLLDAVFRPEIDATLVRLAQEERQLAQQLQATRLHRLQVEGRGFGDPEPADPAEDQEQLSLWDELPVVDRRGLL
jgi:hypothetical protein